MKNEGFVFHVHARVLFTVEELRALKWMAARHYDSKCRGLAREMSEHGSVQERIESEGLVEALLRTQERDEKSGEDFKAPSTLSFSDIDLMCKAMEPGLEHLYEKSEVIYKLRGELFDLIQQMRKTSESVNA